MGEGWTAGAIAASVALFVVAGVCEVGGGIVLCGNDRKIGRGKQAEKEIKGMKEQMSTNQKRLFLLEREKETVEQQVSKGTNE